MILDIFFYREVTLKEMKVASSNAMAITTIPRKLSCSIFKKVSHLESTERKKHTKRLEPHTSWKLFQYHPCATEFYIFSYRVALFSPRLGHPTVSYQPLGRFGVGLSPHHAQNWTDTSCLSQQQGETSSFKLGIQASALSLYYVSVSLHSSTSITWCPRIDQHCLSSKHATVAS